MNKDIRLAFQRIDDIQKMECPEKPDFAKPISIYNSFKRSKDTQYEDGVKQLKHLVEDWAKKTETIEKRLKDDPKAIGLVDKLRGIIHNGKPAYDGDDKIIGMLAGADIGGAMLLFADEVTDLKGVYLQGVKFQKANLEKALLDGAHLECADLQSANFKESNLVEAKLERAYLLRATLKNADLRNARLEDTCLCHADLKNVKNLTLEQLSKAFSLYEVKNLNPELRKQIEKQYPHLLKPDYNVLECNDKMRGEYFSDYISTFKK